MKAKSISGDSLQQIETALQQCINETFKPTLAIVFISIRQDRKAVCEMLRKQVIDVLGATSCGEFINGQQTEGAASILLLELPRDHYILLSQEVGCTNIHKAATDLAQQALDKFRNPSLIVCSTGISTKGVYFDGEALVKSIKDVLGPDKIFFGGMAGDDMTFTGTYVFANDKEVENGLVALVLDADKIYVSGMAITGWKPMGLSRTVTKSSGDKLYTIDNISAVEMYFKYLGKGEKKSDEAFNIFEELGYTYPFIVEREPVVRLF